MRLIIELTRIVATLSILAILVSNGLDHTHWEFWIVFISFGAANAVSMYEGYAMAKAIYKDWGSP